MLSTRSLKNAALRWRRRLPLAAAAAALTFGAGLVQAADVEVRGTLQADQPGAKVSRNLFGQFAEHLGNGI